jgi:trans-aconitate 2-methyltransferase
LTDYRRRLSEGEYEAFLARYADVLTANLPDEHPFPFPFKRILLWGRRG